MDRQASVLKLDHFMLSCSFQHKAYCFEKVFAMLGLFSLAMVLLAPANAARLRAGFASPSLNVAILWITQEGKLFEKNGVDVEALYCPILGGSKPSPLGDSFSTFGTRYDNVLG